MQLATVVGRTNGPYLARSFVLEQTRQRLGCGRASRCDSINIRFYPYYKVAYYNENWDFVEGWAADREVFLMTATGSLLVSTTAAGRLTPIAHWQAEIDATTGSIGQEGNCGGTIFTSSF